MRDSDLLHFEFSIGNCVARGFEISSLHPFPKVNICGTDMWGCVQHLKENAFFNYARVPLKPLVYLVGRIVACGGRKRGNRHTHTDQVQ